MGAGRLLRQQNCGANSCSSTSSSSVASVSPGFPIVATNFAFQYDSDTGKWSLYIIEKESSGAASVYGSKIWATDLYGPPMVYVDAKELLSTSLPSDVSIATLGLNYRFINNYLQIANYDVSGRYHKIWSTTAGGSPLLYVDSGES